MSSDARYGYDYDPCGAKDAACSSWLTACQGAPFQWAAIFHKSDMSFSKGATGLTFYNSAHRSREYETPTKVCCSFCRSPLMDEGRRVCLIFPESIDFGNSPYEMLEWRKAFEVRYAVCVYLWRKIHLPKYRADGSVVIFSMLNERSKSWTGRPNGQELIIIARCWMIWAIPRATKMQYIV